ncbi:hypothetical protein [Streptomyces sp. ML-6]|uniref:hypothetical protein n=1 Tax=Streptomyces sp. ML-6 TaxID=2982693 RepID=UPI0024BFB048|nr:hypothetical protein [Streptomyces sp. ML-6]MDK0520917.1 hypothetical protein [Streptomyces sp. ML-6]
MRRQMLDSNGRRGTMKAASAAVLCLGLGGVLAGCGGATGDGYTAVGAAGAGSGRGPAGAVAPSGKVTLVPLDRDGRDGGGGNGGGGGESRERKGEGRSGSPGPTPGPSAPGDGPGNGTESGTGNGTGAANGGPSRPPGTPGTPGSGGGSASPSRPGPGTTTPAGPAVLTVGAPVRAAADERWCEKVTVEFRNTGGSPARSGTVTFATHIIGGLGVDWGTVESTGPLPAPIDAGAARTRTYTVCVDAWRVPLGMHVETREVTAVSE